MKLLDYMAILRDKQALRRLRRYHHRMMPEIVQFMTSDKAGLSEVVEFLISDAGGRAELSRQMQNFVSEASLFEMLQAVAETHNARLSFSQSGEDLIVDFIFQALRTEKPTYLDIGAYDPFQFSNTARFYLSGSSGVNVEPNPDQYRRFQELRPRDINLNVGIAERRGEMQYYLLDVPTLNTFSQAEAQRYEREAGHCIVGQATIPVITVQDLLESHCGGAFPDFLSVDIEGADELVVASLGRPGSTPRVICIETMSYSKGGQGRKNDILIHSLRARGYLLYADTYINSIFVQEDLWRALKG
jgi:FkbM family methyltransferase